MDNFNEINNNTEENVQVETPATDNSDEKVFCMKCGAELAPDAAFCPKCGQKVGEKISDSDNKKASFGGAKLIGTVVGVVALIAAVIIAVIFLRGVQAKDITLNKKEISVKVGANATLSYTINPADTKDKTVTWSTNNDTIAQVSDGTITGVNEGECVITVSTKNGKTDSCTITVLPAGPDLQAIYNDYCSSSFASIASDGSYLSIDTNPYDKDDYMDYEAYLAIEEINEALNLPESVLNNMNHTRSMDGIQTYSNDEIEISWTYHPNKGMEVNYTLKQ